MEEFGLGPNGGLVYCMEYLLEHYEWLEEQVDIVYRACGMNTVCVQCRTHLQTIVCSCTDVCVGTHSLSGLLSMILTSTASLTFPRVY